MTAEEADDRIILSRRTLYDYMAMAALGEGPDPLNLTLIHDEIMLLEGIAEEHPGKTDKLVNLVSQWVKLRDGLRAKMH
jgi:hypothetical protein